MASSSSSSAGVKVPRKPGKRKALRAGLSIDVGTTSRLLRKRRVTEKFGEPAIIAVAGALDYLGDEVLARAAKISTERKKKTILPSHVEAAMESDRALAVLLAKYRGGGHIAKLTKLYPKDKTKDTVPAKKKKASAKGKGKAAAKSAEPAEAAEPAAAAASS